MKYKRPIELAFGLHKKLLGSNQLQYNMFPIQKTSNILNYKNFRISLLSFHALMCSTLMTLMDPYLNNGFESSLKLKID